MVRFRPAMRPRLGSTSRSQDCRFPHLAHANGTAERLSAVGSQVLLNRAQGMPRRPVQFRSFAAPQDDPLINDSDVPRARCEFLPGAA